MNFMNQNSNNPWTSPQKNTNDRFASFFGGQSDEFHEESNLSKAVLSVRLAFMRKVYGILAAQLAFTTVVSVLMMAAWPSVQMFMLNNSWLFIANLVLTLGVTVALMWKEARTSYPTNFILLGAFTLLNSITVGFFVSQYDAMLVIQAFCLTTLIVVSLTIYTMQTKRDLEWTGSLLYALLTAVVFGGFANLFFRSAFVETVMCIVGAFLFSAYIIYDTQQIMKRVNAEEYIIAVINLYMDIINLFIKIVKILDAIKQSQDKNKKNNKRK